jgi:uncharacterized membrane protein
MPVKRGVERKRGAPRGNQNARKHGYYSKVLDEAQRMDFELASGVNGIDDEIALLRVKIKAILEKDPENFPLITQAVKVLTRMVQAHFNMSKGDKRGFKEAIEKLWQNVAVPAGIAVGTILGKKA